MSRDPLYGTDSKGQAFFSFDDPTPKHTRTTEHHLFYGALVEKPAGELLARRGASYRREYKLLNAWLTPARQTHITLMSLGDGKSEYVTEVACHVGSLIQAKPFDVCFDLLSAFGGGALVLRSGDHSPALQDFWRKLSAVVHDSPLQDFVTNRLEPHVTLLRDRNEVPKIQGRLVEPLRWRVRAFALIHSHKGEYTFPGTWQLSGQDDSHAVM